MQPRVDNRLSASSAERTPDRKSVTISWTLEASLHPELYVGEMHYQFALFVFPAICAADTVPGSLAIRRRRLAREMPRNHKNATRRNGKR